MSCVYEDNLVIILDKTSLPHLRSSLSSVTVDSSVPPPPTTPTASSSGRQFLLAENRYGREETLALMPDQPTSLPFLQSINVVEMFWFSVQNLTWNITCEGFEGHCHEYLEPAIEFESLLADYVLSTGRNDTVVAARLLSRAQESVSTSNLQVLIASNCVKTVTLLRYLGYVANCSHNEVMHQSVLKAIMHLASSRITLHRCRLRYWCNLF